MCGIFGWTRTNDKGATVVASVLIVKNVERGEDSWGFSADGMVYKGLGSAVRMKRSAFKRLCEGQVVMGHTRFATQGDVRIANCHPFAVGNIVGAHNGIVHNHGMLNGLHGRMCEVDSEHIFRHVAEGGDLTEIQAYGAVEFTEADSPGVVYLARFHGGQLAIAKTKAGMFWSSAESDLVKALRVAGLKPTLYKVDAGKLYAADKDELYDIGPFAIAAPPVKTWTAKDAWGYSWNGKDSRTGKDGWGTKVSDWGEQEDAEWSRIDREERELKMLDAR